MFENLFKTPEKDRKKKMLELAMQAGIPITNLFTEESPIAETGRLMQKFDLPDVEVPGPIKGGFLFAGGIKAISKAGVKEVGEKAVKEATEKTGKKTTITSLEKQIDELA